MITLSSDFGSPYPAAMRGEILKRSDARLVDVSHTFPRQDVRATAFWLREMLPSFPPAVHLVVVDPTVGTDRAAIALRVGDHALVGPDNGVLLPAARRLATEQGLATGDLDALVEDGTETQAGPIGAETQAGPIGAYVVDDEDAASSTFHGRDVFAPAAAVVHEAGVETFHERERFAPAADMVDLSFPTPEVGEAGGTGEVLVVDDFGNAITNLPGGLLDDAYGRTVTVDDEAVPAARTYAHVDQGERVVAVGSHGNVELAVNHGRGDEAFGVTAGDRVELLLPSPTDR